MHFIWQSPDWPSFHWRDDVLSQRLAALRHEQGRLTGRAEALGFRFREDTLLQTLTRDVVNTSAIEGERLQEQQVRSSIARRLGIDIEGFVTPDRAVEGIVQITLDATLNCNQPLDAERLFSWHAALFPTGRSEWGHKLRIGAWREDAAGPMEIVSGAFGREKVQYVAPPAAQLEREMNAFLEWFNAPAQADDVLKAALAHLWFVVIHPFDDGNGRITRALADMTLARGQAGPPRLYSMSTEIEKTRSGYYEALKAVTARDSMDITSWLLWFVDCMTRAVASAMTTMDHALLKADFWDAHRGMGLNERQARVLNRLLDGFEGKLTSGKWATMTRTSQDTAARDIADLIAKGILRKGEAGGRSASYELVFADGHHR